MLGFRKECHHGICREHTEDSSKKEYSQTQPVHLGLVVCLMEARVLERIAYIRECQKPRFRVSPNQSGHGSGEHADARA
jgi:hypothetical protein